MSRELRDGEDLDGALLRAFKGERRWRARRVDGTRLGYMGETFELTPLGDDVRHAKEGGRTQGGVRRIFRTRQELWANRWQRVA